jgi:hypothetical protein
MICRKPKFWTCQRATWRDKFCIFFRGFAISRKHGHCGGREGEREMAKAWQKSLAICCRSHKWQEGLIRQWLRRGIRKQRVPFFHDIYRRRGGILFILPRSRFL